MRDIHLLITLTEQGVHV